MSQLVTAYHLVCSGLGAAFISDWMVLYDHDDMRYYKICLLYTSERGRQ